MNHNGKQSAVLLKRAKFEIYRDKKNELMEYISEQMAIWGAYENIPEHTLSFIDRQFVTLGIFGKKIDAWSMEQDPAGDQGVTAL